MKTRREKNMGRFNVEIEIVNNQDLMAVRLGVLDPAKVRRMTISGLVDTGATRLVLPAKAVKFLGLPVKKKRLRVRYADGRRAMRSEAEEVRLYLLGRDGHFNAVVEPGRESALIGAIVLEDLDFLVDSARARLVPRDPDFVVSEIE